MKKEITVYIQAKYQKYADTFDYCALDMIMGDDYILLETRVLEFDVPPREVLVNGTITAYRKQQQTLRAQAEKDCLALEDTINKLLALENKVKKL